MTQFSEITLFPVGKESKVVIARGSVVVANTIKVKFTVMNGSNGRFVSLPAEKSDKVDENGKTRYFPNVSMVTRDLSDELNRLVLSKLDAGEFSDPAASRSESSSESAPSVSAAKSAGGKKALPF